MATGIDQASGQEDDEVAFDVLIAAVRNALATLEQ